MQHSSISVYWVRITFLFLVISFANGQNFNKHFIDGSLQAASAKNQNGQNYKSVLNQLRNYIEEKPDSIQTEIYRYVLDSDTARFSFTYFYEDYAQLLAKQGTITYAVDLYIDAVWHFIDKGDKKALYSAEKALKLSKEHLFYTGIVKSIEAQGQYYEIVEGNVEQASTFYFEAVDLCKKHKLAYIADIYHTIGVLFHTSDNYKKAKIYYQMAYEEAKRQNNGALQKKCLINLGSIHSSLTDFNTAETYFLQSLEIPENSHYDFDTYANLGNLYIRQENYQKAMHFLEKATENHPDNYDADNNLRFLIDAKVKLKDTTSMHIIMNQAENALLSINSLRDKSLLLRSASDYYKLTGDFEKALQYNEAYLNVYGQIIQNQKNQTLHDIEAKYQSEKIKASLEKKEKQQTLLIIGVCVLMTFLIGLYVFYRKRLAYKNTIQQQKITDLTQKNKLLAMSSMIEGQEAERLRIARDLHDSLGGLLSSVKAHFTIFKNKFDKDQTLDITQKTYQLIDNSCLEVRRISHNMIPHSLSLSGLKGTLEDLSEHMESEGYTITLDVHHLPENLATTKQITIFRIIQEILSNIRKHADAKNVFIQLIGSRNEIQLIVEDDGKGFDYKEAVKNKGLGLNSINSRVEFLDGTIQWESVIAEGTTITINIPIG